MAIETTFPLLKNRRTKIVATIGPASHNPTVISGLIAAGVNVFRLNMSHGDHEAHRATYQHLRTAAASAGYAIAILADLAGPKIRIGRLKGGQAVLRPGDRLTVTTRDIVGDGAIIPSQYATLAQDLSPGDRILLADGAMELLVKDIHGTEILCEITEGGILKERAGINLPAVNISAPSLTSKDRADAHLALELGVDFLALSFVRNAADLAELKRLIHDHASHAAVIAKIERPEALVDSEAILKGADGIMVARGDLGVELPPEQVPVVQRQLIDQALALNRPVIIATQMLESMILNARPTRAEVADVSLSVSSGTDALMLSGETAIGAHPVLAVQMLDRIARQTEGYLWHHGAFGSIGAGKPVAPPIPFGDAVADATALLSRLLSVRAIVVISESGRTAVTVSSARPAAPVIAFSANPQTYRRMSLLWGVIPMAASRDELGNPVPLARQAVQRLGLATSGSHILLVRGFHGNPRRNAPSITLLSV
ncbi:MAG: pyruvate kinase [Gammaproteobacteria bacterium]